MAQQYIGTGRLGTHQSAAYTGTAGTITNAIGSGSYKVRVVVTSAAYVKVGDSPTATSSDVYMAADAPEYFSCTPGQKVSAIQVSAGGTLHVTEIV
jgi:hypothetical protein